MKKLPEPYTHTPALVMRTTIHILESRISSRMPDGFNDLLCFEIKYWLEKRAMEGLLVVFEGIDGSGKGTQRELLKNALLKKNIPTIVLSYPDRQSQYGLMIEEFLHKKMELNVNEQFLLFLLNIVRDTEKIKNLIATGNIVIIDRYFMSTIAYQCAEGFNYENAKRVMEIFQMPYPSVIIYLDITPDLSFLRKKKQKGETDHFESNIILLNAVKEVYEKMIKETYPNPVWTVMNGQEDIDVLHTKILSDILQKLNKIAKNRKYE